MFDYCAAVWVIWCEIIKCKFRNIHFVKDEYQNWFKIQLRKNIYRFRATINIQIKWAINKSLINLVITFDIYFKIGFDCRSTCRNLKIWRWSILIINFGEWNTIIWFVEKLAVFYITINRWLAKKWCIGKSNICNNTVIIIQGVAKIVLDQIQFVIFTI
jgi:hypothetical protein